jgi:hypothetical protein
MVPLLELVVCKQYERVLLDSNLFYFLDQYLVRLCSSKLDKYATLWLIFGGIAIRQKVLSMFVTCFYTTYIFLHSSARIYAQAIGKVGVQHFGPSDQRSNLGGHYFR